MLKLHFDAGPWPDFFGPFIAGERLGQASDLMG